MLELAGFQQDIPLTEFKFIHYLNRSTSLIAEALCLRTEAATRYLSSHESMQDLWYFRKSKGTHSPSGLTSSLAEFIWLVPDLSLLFFLIVDFALICASELTNTQPVKL